MNFFLETLRVIVMSLYYLLEAFLLLFIPVRKKSVANEIVLITGAGSGMGKLMSLKFAQLGATLVLWDINEEGNKETARLVRKIGNVRVHDYICDCSKMQEVFQVADKVKKEVGDVSILINNAGIVTGKMFLDIPDTMIEKTIQVNTMAHFWTVKAFLPAMIASNHGHVVTISSAAGLMGVSRMTDYCASKFAAYGFAESLALEMSSMKKNGVKSTIVCPYFVNTGMFEGAKTKWPNLLPILDEEYAAERIVSGVRRDEKYIFMPQSIYFFNVFTRMFPEKMTLMFQDYFGMFNVMDFFRGRTNISSSKHQTTGIKSQHSPERILKN